MGSDRIRAEGKKSSSLIPGSKPKQFSFLQPRYQDRVETDSIQENQHQANHTSALSHSFGQMSVRPIQAKLTIGQPNDKYEHEADRVASQVVQQISTPSSAQSTQGQSLQRMDEPEEEELQAKPSISPLQRMPEEEEELQAKPQISAIQRSLISPVVQRLNQPKGRELPTKPKISVLQRSLISPVVQRLNQPKGRELPTKPKISVLQRSLISPVVQRMDMPEEEEELQAKPMISPKVRSLLSPALQREDLQAKSILQRREAIAGREASTDLDSAINSAKGGGQPLEPGLQQSMGQAMGADFSRVRIHTDSQSDQLNQSIQARAFTTGQDVFFRQGEYKPGSRGGQELIAHELTHVVQQMEGREKQKMKTKAKEGKDNVARESEGKALGEKQGVEIQRNISGGIHVDETMEAGTGSAGTIQRVDLTGEESKGNFSAANADSNKGIKRGDKLMIAKAPTARHIAFRLSNGNNVTFNMQDDDDEKVAKHVFGEEKWNNIKSNFKNTF